MDEIRKFMAENEVSDIAKDLPVGDEERFFAKLEEKQREIHFRRVTPRRNVSFLRVVTVPVAACLLCFLALQIYLHSFEAEGNVLDKIYSDYRSEVLALSSEIIEMSETEDDALANERTIEIITWEAIPMEELLPEELSLKERAEIMRGYYAQRIDGVKRLKSSINNSDNNK